MVSGDAAHVASRDALRADLAETKLLVHDLTKQLQEAQASLSSSSADLGVKREQVESLGCRCNGSKRMPLKPGCQIKTSMGW